VDNFSQSGVSSTTLYALTGFYAVGYAIILVLECLV